MFRHACRLGLVSKRATSRYKSGAVLELGEGQKPGLRAARPISLIAVGSSV
jgi:hypothetical protein